MKSVAQKMLFSLDEKSLSACAHQLAAEDDDFAEQLKIHGVPPLWAREPGFPTLIQIILEQQVSLASARAAFDRLRRTVFPITPRRFLKLDDATLKAIGFSRQKTLYVRLLAQAILDRQLDLIALAEMPDDEVRQQLRQLKGIGAWTADIYLLMALRRPDIWPPGDIGLLVALQQLKNLPSRPSFEEFILLGDPWRPYRAVAARLLWQFYLKARNQPL